MRKKNTRETKSPIASDASFVSFPSTQQPAKQTRTTMWLCCLAILFAGLLGSSSNLYAQQPDTVYQDWSFLGEDTSHIDVSYRIVKCSSTSPDQVHLSVFNENPVAKTASFTVTIKDNATNNSTSSQISFAAALASMNRADCANLNALKVNVPSGYNPSQLTVTITF